MMMIVCHPIEQVKLLTMQKTYDLPFSNYITLKALDIIIGYPNVHLIAFSTDTDDFNNTIFNITFAVDENAAVAISDISALIPIVDDDKDEADIQFFIAFLEVVDAVNMDMIDIGRNFSRGIIVDSDGKY